jgi:hypothetical protein
VIPVSVAGETDKKPQAKVQATQQLETAES